MYSRIEDFVSAYKHESECTNKVLSAMTDESLNQEKTAGDNWNAGYHAWHIASTPYAITNQFGTTVEATPKPENLTVQAIVDEHKRASDAVIEQAKANWGDGDMSKPVEAFGFPMPLGLWLNMLINHEVHHRGQLSILMRQAGLTVPSIYGPNKEETAKYMAENAGAEAH